MSTDTAVLNELLDPVGDCLDIESARRLANLRAPSTAQARVEELAAKSTAGTLSSDERAEYEVYVSFGTFIATLQSKARKILRDNESN